MKNIKLIILGVSVCLTNCKKIGSNSGQDSKKQSRNSYEYSQELEDSLKDKIKRSFKGVKFSRNALAKLIVNEEFFSIDEAKCYLAIMLDFKKPNHMIFMEYQNGFSLSSCDLDACFIYISRKDPLWCLDLLFNDYLKFGFLKKGKEFIPNCKILLNDDIPKIGFLGAIVTGWDEGDSQGYQKWLDKVKLANRTNSFEHEFSREYFYKEPEQKKD